MKLHEIYKKNILLKSVILQYFLAIQLPEDFWFYGFF